MKIGRPQPGDYAPFYQPYLDASAAVDDARDLLMRQDGILAAMTRWPEAKGAHRYADGKWTVAQVIGHMADTERVFAYRLMRIARGDTTPLPGFDQNAYQLHAGFEARTLNGLVDELTVVRRATLTFIATLDAAALDREGVASNTRVTARALVWLIAGHFQHHTGILRDRYGM
jgi:uncharacterized damage-inducible protein DinB